MKFVFCGCNENKSCMVQRIRACNSLDILSYPCFPSEWPYISYAVKSTYVFKFPETVDEVCVTVAGGCGGRQTAVTQTACATYTAATCHTQTTLTSVRGILYYLEAITVTPEAAWLSSKINIEINHLYCEKYNMNLCSEKAIREIRNHVKHH